MFTTQSAFDRLDLDIAESERGRFNMKSIRRTLGTPCHRFQPPAPSRVLGPPGSATALPRAVPPAPQATPCSPHARSRKMPLTSLCNQRIVNGHPLGPRIPELQGSRPVDLHFMAPLRRSCTRVQSPKRRFPQRRRICCKQHPRPRVAPRLAACERAATSTSRAPSGAVRTTPDLTRFNLFDQGEPDWPGR